MSVIQLEIKGIDKLQKIANKFPAVAQKHIDKTIVQAIGTIDIANKPLTPVRTGRLLHSFIPVFRPFEGVYGTKVPYASSVHDLYSAGTRYKFPSLNKTAIAGFLTIAVKNSEKFINQLFAKALKDITEDAVK